MGTESLMPASSRYKKGILYDGFCAQFPFLKKMAEVLLFQKAWSGLSSSCFRPETKTQIDKMHCQCPQVSWERTGEGPPGLPDPATSEGMGEAERWSSASQEVL